MKEILVGSFKKFLFKEKEQGSLYLLQKDNKNIYQICSHFDFDSYPLRLFHLEKDDLILVQMEQGDLLFFNLLDQKIKLTCSLNMNKVLILDLKYLEQNEIIVAYSLKALMGISYKTQSPYVLELASHLDNISAIEIEQ